MSKSTYEVNISDNIDAENEAEAIKEFRKMVATIEASCFDVKKTADYLKDFD